MACEGSELLAAARIPYARAIGGILSGGDDARPVRAELRAPHSAGVPFERDEHSATLRIPDPCGLVQRASHEPSSIRTELSAPYGLDLKHDQRFAGLGLPRPDRAVVRCRDNPLAIGTEMRRFHIVRVAAQKGEHL